MRRIILSLAALATMTVSSAHAQTWIDSVLPERSFNAGTVAKGSKVHHTFALMNRLNQEVRIATWRTKCGCTEVRVGAQVIPPGTQTTIEAVIDTTRFEGYKPSGLTLVFERPTHAEIDLDLSCFIRSDVVLSPGGIDFGIVHRSSTVKPTVSVNLSYYGGQSNWGITRMQTRSNRISAKLNEQSRSAYGQVTYILTATLDTSEVNGFFKDEITLFTNDPSGKTIPVAVSGMVQSALTVSPSPLLLGQVKAGQVLTKTLLVRSSQPFRLTTVRPGKDDLTVKFDAEPLRPVHTVTLTVTTPSEPGPFYSTIEIDTDLKDELPAKITVFANIVP